MKQGQFYTYRDGSKAKLCKQCLTLHIDNFDPNTFLWLLEDFDVPYVPAWWNKFRDQAFAKNPKKMNGMSVFGKYLSKTKIKQYSKWHWKDSEEAQLYESGALANKELTEEEKKVQAEYEAKLKEGLANGEIGQSEYKTLMPVPTQNAEMSFTQSSELDKAAYNRFQEDDFMKPQELPDPAADLTKEDKIYLAMKWGRLYKPNEWLELEKKYRDMEDAFAIDDPDTKSSLILICKADLKMNQALDADDTDGALKQSRIYESLRKSANLTAAQNKKDKSEVKNSISQLTLYCQKTKGKIPRMDVSAPRDIVDKELMDNQSFLTNLVKTDTALAREIEDYIKKKEYQEEQKRLEEQGKEVVITDEDIQEYNEARQSLSAGDAQLIKKEVEKE